MKNKFIVDVNVGKLARRLRMLGYDTLFINGAHDDELIKIASKEDRILLTKDSGIMKRRIVTTGKVRAMYIGVDEVKEQLQQVVEELGLEAESEPFTICMECNTQLVAREKNEIRDIVPPYVFKTQDRFMQCSNCGRVYWKGTHWERMAEELDEIMT